MVLHVVLYGLLGVQACCLFPVDGVYQVPAFPFVYRVRVVLQETGQAYAVALLLCFCPFFGFFLQVLHLGPHFFCVFAAGVVIKELLVEFGVADALQPLVVSFFMRFLAHVCPIEEYAQYGGYNQQEAHQASPAQASAPLSSGGWYLWWYVLLLFCFRLGVIWALWLVLCPQVGFAQGAFRTSL